MSKEKLTLVALNRQVEDLEVIITNLKQRMCKHHFSKYSVKYLTDCFKDVTRTCDCGYKETCFFRIDQRTGRRKYCRFILGK